MNYLNFLILQFIAHLLADFVFQSDKSENEIKERGGKSLALITHSITVLLLSWTFSLQWNFIIAAVIITSFHYIIDVINTALNKNDKLKNISFFIDQSFHLLVIFGVVTIFAKYFQFKPVIEIAFDTKTLLIAAAYLFCTKPTNILIKEILKAYKIIISKNSTDDIPNAGKLIGNVERILALTLILNNQYEAVGFIIAAKSILRFKDTDINKPEYVLVGTLLSFGIVVIIGVLIQFYK